MNKNKIYKSIISKLKQRAGEFGHREQKRFYSLIPTKYQALGVQTPAIRQIALELSKEISDYNSADILELADYLWQQKIWDVFRVVAFSLYNLRSYIECDQLIKYLDKWINDIDNWETCDCLAMNTGRLVVLSDPEKLDNIFCWIKSKNKWHRRFGVVFALTPYATKLKGEIANKIKNHHYTFLVLDKLMTEKERDVQMALGWLIRKAATNGNTKKIIKYLDKWPTTNPNTYKIFRHTAKFSIKTLPEKFKNYLKERLG